MAKVYFIGAGPGDPDLITVKGRNLISQADIIIYAGSLVNPEIIGCRRQGSEVYNSASMTLGEVIGVIENGINSGKSVVRVHTGDPSIYGAIREQIDLLEPKGIECEVVPGVSSFTAAASVIKREFTLPGVSQSVIITRISGRTEVPELEELGLLAKHRASMAIFLSVQLIDNVVDRLLEGYTKGTPVTIVERATWPNQRIIEGTLADIADKIKKLEITGTAMIMVGEFLNDKYELSKLYDENFKHKFRE